MSLAGSIGRGKTPEDDERLARALLHSAKDRGEHAVVVNAMLEALGNVCTRLQASETLHCSNSTTSSTSIPASPAGWPTGIRS